MKTDDNTTQDRSTTGFAPAAGATAPTTLITDSADITCGETSVPTQGDTMPAFFARPRQAEER